jgi:hypothetical protein
MSAVLFRRSDPPLDAIPDSSRPIGPPDAPLAWLIRPGRGEGTRFLTPAGARLQVGIIERSQAAAVPLHTHRAVPAAAGWAEYLHVLEGVLDIAIHASDGSLVEQLAVAAGSGVLLQAGAHAARISAGARVLEIRLGPWAGASDKIPLAGPPA